FKGNIDVLVVAGYALLTEVPVLGTLLVLSKPQQLGLALLDVPYSRRHLVLLAGVITASFVVNGNWVVALAATVVHTGPQHQPWNFSLFPYSLLIAVPLCIAGLMRRDRILLAVATPFAVPYANGYIWPFPVLALLMPRLRRGEQVGLVLG